MTATKLIMSLAQIIATLARFTESNGDCISYSQRKSKKLITIMLCKFYRLSRNNQRPAGAVIRPALTDTNNNNNRPTGHKGKGNRV